MKFAYLINCHKNMKHVSRLAHRIHSEDSHVFIHIDKKVDNNDVKSLFAYTSDLNHCYISKTRIDGKLDDRSLVDIVMVLVSDAKRNASINSIHYSYFVNMSGQDYLIKPLSFIEEKLSANYPDSYISYRDTNDASWVAEKFNRNKGLIQYRNWVLKRSNSLIRKFLQGVGIILRNILKLFGQTASQRVIKKGWKYYQGSAWWILPDIVIDPIEKYYYNPTEFAEIMIDESVTPEETYFQSMLFHILDYDKSEIEIKKTRLQNLMTYVDFGPKSNRPQLCHPYVITTDDYKRLSTTECLFARKFDDAVDSDIIDKIDDTLLK